MEVNALYRLRSAQGVAHLADKYDAERLNAACRRAIDVGDPSYKTGKGILAAGTEHDGDDVLRAEGRVTFIDGILAVAVLVGLVLNATLDWWWADPAAGFVLVFYALREARHLFNGEGA